MGTAQQGSHRRRAADAAQVEPSLLPATPFGARGGKVRNEAAVLAELDFSSLLVGLAFSLDERVLASSGMALTVALHCSSSRALASSMCEQPILSRNRRSPPCREREGERDRTGLAQTNYLWMPLRS